MEENSNLTAERSLEIITEQIERSRQAVSKYTGWSLFVAGFCTMGISVVIAIINIVAVNAGIFFPFGHLLWALLPVVIWCFIRNAHKENEHVPVNFIGTLVNKIWWTFAVFAFGIYVFGSIVSCMVSMFYSPIEVGVMFSISPIIILLMTMTISITGHVLKKHWMVWFGITGSLLFVIISIVAGFLLSRFCTPQTVALWSYVAPCLYIFICAFVGLTLPGWLLKKQK